MLQRVAGRRRRPAAPPLLRLAATLAIAITAPPGAAATTTLTRPAPLPTFAYTPYVETWLPGGLASLAAGSGAHDLTLAFLQTPRRGSCRPTWNGSRAPGMGIGRYAADALVLARAGDSLTPSFGGWGADTEGTDLADSCRDPASIAAAYESVIAAYGATRLDLDIESRALDDPAAITRRNQAIRMVEAWARRRGRPLQVQVTLPVLPSGLAPSGLAVLANALQVGARVDLVNIMAFDYYDGTTAMGRAAEDAATGLVGQLAALYPGRPRSRLWRMVAITLLPGIDDNRRRTEVTTLADVAEVAAFARRHAIGSISIWSVQRDNGGCPGAVDRNHCSGVRQAPWAFSRVLEAAAAPRSA